MYLLGKQCLSLNLVFSYKNDKLNGVCLEVPLTVRRNVSKMWSLIQVLSLCQRLLISHFPALLLSFFLTSAGVINKDSELDAITFALNNTSALSNITIDLRTFNATEPANDVCEQGKIHISSDQERMLETSAQFLWNCSFHSFPIQKA